MILLRPSYGKGLILALRPLKFFLGAPTEVQNLEKNFLSEKLHEAHQIGQRNVVTMYVVGVNLFQESKVVKLSPTPFQSMFYSPISTNIDHFAKRLTEYMGR